MDIKYTKNHEWVKLEDNIATVGITNYAQKNLGDVVFVDFPDVGTELQAGDSTCVVESVKAASDIYTPMTGKLIEVNEAFASDPSLVNSAGELDTWFFKIEATNSEEASNLLSDTAYQELLD